jgi:hypothetical protein
MRIVAVGKHPPEIVETFAFDCYRRGAFGDFWTARFLRLPDAFRGLAPFLFAGRLHVELAPDLHLDIRFEQRSNGPLHLRLTLPHTKTSVARWQTYYGSGLIAAALLEIFGRIRPINVEPGIKWFYRYYKIHRF